MIDKPNWLERWGFPKGNYRLLVLGAIGLLLLAASSLTPGQKPTPTPLAPDEAFPSATSDYHQRLTRDLERVLESVAGAGTVRVMVKLSAQPEEVLALDQTSTTRQTEERDGQGISRYTVETSQQQQTVLARGPSGDLPVITTVKKPIIEGVLVVCSGGTSARVRSDVARAVATLLDISIYRIQVLPMR